MTSRIAVEQVRSFAAALMLCGAEADLAALKRIRFLGRETETRLAIRHVIGDTVAEWVRRRRMPEDELLRAVSPPDAGLLRPAEEPNDSLQSELLRADGQPD
jgi:hypothetical protein